MFDAVAPRYDLLNRLMSLGLDGRWRRRQVERLRLSGPARVLDLATGTADVALAIARRYPQAQVVGVDPSVCMLAIGRRKVAASGLASRIQLELGDAQALPFPDASFDGTCISFGIRNVPDRLRALCEMRRVTRPGSRVVILELGEPEESWLSPLARLYVHHLVPALGRWLSKADAYRYLQRSMARFPPAADFAATLPEAGLEVVAVERLGLGAAHLFVSVVA
jgi:demethylmenaquinone methyltransferase/2-methoxy-6-polyprenyl-1,4-benzoquinol methylase